MAINSIDFCDNIAARSPFASNSKAGLAPCHLMKVDFNADGLLASANRVNLQKRDTRSPYLSSDRVQLLSRVTERRFVHKNDFVSSFPLAANIYKASSDEFKAIKRSNKKVKKSVLTLPNEPAPIPQVCTVSDMNDSEYYNREDDDRKPKIKKRLPIQNRKARVRNKDFEFYDRDARHCSQLNIDLDCSSTDMINKHFDGDRKRAWKKPCPTQKSRTNAGTNSHNVWEVLRNMNRFQFRPSPRISEESIISPKKKKGFVRRRNNRNDRRVIETCRTEEIAYITEIEVTSPSLSRSSSFDRVTVIDKNNELSKMCSEFRQMSTNQMLRNRSRIPRLLNKIDNTIMPKNNNLRDIGSKENKLVLQEKKRLDSSNIDKLRDSSASSANRGSIDSSNFYRKRRNVPHKVKNNTNQIRTKQPENMNVRYNYIGNNRPGRPGLDRYRKDKDKSPKESSDESDVNNTNVGYNKFGLTNVDLPKVETNNNHDAENGMVSTKRKSRLVTTMPSTAMMPKLTVADIKRRLAHIKFPLVILGRDQLSSNVEIVAYEHPQFNGLDEQIWPFMIEWCNGPKTKDIFTKNQLNKRIVMPFDRINCLRKVNNEISVNKLVKDKKVTINDVYSNNKKKVENKRVTQYTDVNNVTLQAPKKLKQIRQFKDKMLKLLYKKPSPPTLLDICPEITQPSDSKHNEVHECMSPKRNVKLVDVNTVLKIFTGLPPMANKLSISYSPSLCQKLPPTKPLWSKGKWASEFIENIIKKIKSGVYYNLEDNYYSKQKKIKIGLKEASIQTVSMLDDINQSNNFKQHYNQCLDLIPKLDVKKYDPLKNIPGFDETFPALEIKTLNFNQVSVRHCMTNVMVQFDVTYPEESEGIILDAVNSYSCVPISADSQTKILKCKTTILNAVLPAELCCVLPKIMRNFTDLSMNLTLPVIPISKTEPLLSTITELARCESRSCMRRTMIPIFISPVLRRLKDGRFAGSKLKRVYSKQTILDRALRTVKYCWFFIKMVLSTLSTKPLLNCEADPFILKMCKAKDSMAIYSPPSNIQSSPETSACTALQLYTGSNGSSSFDILKKLNFTYLSEKYSGFRNSSFDWNMLSSVYTIKLAYYNYHNDITFNMVMGDKNGFEKSLSVTINNVEINSLYKNGFAKRRCLESKDSLTAVVASENKPFLLMEYNGDSCFSKVKKNLRNRKEARLPNPKIRRKGFVKLYRRCKSSSNISSERTCTAMSKISNLDDFFQALGTGKLLSSAFDGQGEEMILSSIGEMKSWITEISPRQALLVLLLTNKKSTPNLVRFRPVLLQGIAVNRITRANELDMEIEVIERENLNKLSQYEGISYLPASVENYDTLLEELYWIAKTTASDYQRTFDESSEKLLKSLLEKRKKLNPSYLRVMARYVGLGLLKLPNKKN